MSRTHYRKQLTVSLIEIALATTVERLPGSAEIATPEEIANILERQLNGFGFEIRHLPSTQNSGHYVFQVGDIVITVPKNTARRGCNLLVLHTGIDRLFVSPLRVTVHRLVFNDIAHIVQLESRNDEHTIRASDITRYMRRQSALQNNLNSI